MGLFTLLFLLCVQILRYIFGGILGVNVVTPLLISVLILLCIFVIMEGSDMSFAIGLRSRLGVGPSIGITYLCSVGDGDWNEVSIDLLVLSIIIIWE